MDAQDQALLGQGQHDTAPTRHGTPKPSPDAILRSRAENPKMRERDLALQLGISEAEFVAAHCGAGALRIDPRANDLLLGLEAVGEVMALTRNESAVHEKIGIYDKVVPGEHAAMVLGAQIDLRIFPKLWAFGFAVEKRDGDTVRHSLQFFDAAGDAVHKVHLRPASSLAAYRTLVDALATQDQGRSIAIVPAVEGVQEDAAVDADALRERWGRLTDVHQFHGMLKALKLDRLAALRLVDGAYAWPLARDSVGALLGQAAEAALPIMCFVGNRGCIQIHSGPIAQIKPMGPWINVLDETFHMHLRTDHIAEVWRVRKPAGDGVVTSVEAYGRDGKLIIQFFGKRHEGEAERADWRRLADALPRAPVAA